MKKVIIIGVILLFITILMVASLRKGKGFEVTTAKVDKGDITEVVTGSGKLYPVVQVDISANVAGEIIKMTVEEGDTVKKGQLLVMLDQERYKASVDQAKSQVLSARANYRLAKLDYNRIKELFEKKLVSSAECEKAQAALEQAERSRSHAQGSRRCIVQNCDQISD